MIYNCEACGRETFEREAGLCAVCWGRRSQVWRDEYGQPREDYALDLGHAIELLASDLKGGLHTIMHILERGGDAESSRIDELAQRIEQLETNHRALERLWHGTLAGDADTTVRAELVHLVVGPHRMACGAKEGLGVFNMERVTCQDCGVALGTAHAEGRPLT